MKKLYYTVEVRDKEGKLYKDSRGFKVTGFNFQDDEQDENLIHLICQHTFRDYQAVCKEDSGINIDVRYFHEITKTYPLLYSFYGAENKFIKH